MRSTPHPLTAIVAFHPEQAAKDRACGLLVSSFNTVTLSPRPIVSFNIKLPSSTYNAISESGSFIASGLASTETAYAFAKGPRASTILENIIDKEGKLKDGKSGTWWMACKVVEKDCMKIGDHVIVIGEVFKAASYGGEQCEPGIVYLDGKYRRVGEVLDTGA